MGYADEVPSPTYTLVQTYDGERGELWHVDLYRLKQPDDAWELGLEDAFASAACLIEWPERLGGQLPADRLDVESEAGRRGPHSRSHRSRRMESKAWIDLKRSRA
jgi:tRNA threonylcarbamoyladenosine biosynthesis protein TsaE